MHPHSTVTPPHSTLNTLHTVYTPALTLLILRNSHTCEIYLSYTFIHTDSTKDTLRAPHTTRATHSSNSTEFALHKSPQHSPLSAYRAPHCTLSTSSTLSTHTLHTLCAPHTLHTLRRTTHSAHSTQSTHSSLRALCTPAHTRTLHTLHIRLGICLQMRPPANSTFHTLRAPHSTHHLPHSTLRTAKLYTPHFTFHCARAHTHTYTHHPLHLTLYTSRGFPLCALLNFTLRTLHTSHSTQHYPHCTYYTSHFTHHSLDSPQSRLETSYATHRYTANLRNSTLYTLDCNLGTPHATRYKPRPALCNRHAIDTQSTP